MKIIRLLFITVALILFINFYCFPQTIHIASSQRKNFSENNKYKSQGGVDYPSQMLSLGKISGTQFFDKNRNGVKEADESGLANWKIRLYGKIDDSITTDLQGNYEFNNLSTGSYLVTQDLETIHNNSSRQNFILYGDSIKQYQQIQIFKHFLVIAETAYNYWHRPIIHGGGGGSFNGFTIPAIIQQDIYANYFTTTSSSISLRLTANLKAGWKNISVYCDSGGLVQGSNSWSRMIYPVVIAPTSLNHTGKNFPHVPLEIKGKVYQFYKDCKEGLSGQRLNLVGPIDTFAITDSSGNFVFKDFPLGFFTLSLDPSSGWNQSYPPTITTPAEEQYSNFLGLMQHIDQLLSKVLNYRLTPSELGGGGGSFLNYSIFPSEGEDSAAVYTVSSSNKSIQVLATSSKGYGNILIETDSNACPRSTTTTGYFMDSRRNLFSKYYLPISIYTNHELIQDGFSINDFGLTQPGSISGTISPKISSLELSSETCNWKIYIGGPIIDSTLTDSTGYFHFDNLPIGMYIITQGHKDGWRQIYPTYSEFKIDRDMVINNMNSLISHLSVLASDAIRYRNLVYSRLGGNGEFRGYVMLDILYTTEGGVFTCSNTTNSVHFSATSTYGYGTISANMDTAGMLNNFNFTGEFSNLGSNIVDHTFIQRGISDLNFNNKKYSTYTAEMNKGWNLFSLPIEVEDSSLYILFPMAISKAFEYHGTYSPIDSIQQGKGYWIKFDSTFNHQIFGYFNNSDTILVKQGWNLIGSISNTVPISSITSVPIGIINSDFYAYSNAYSITNAIHPGKGYWIKIKQDGKLILSLSGSK